MFLFLSTLAAINAAFASSYHRFMEFGSPQWNITISTSLAVVFAIISAVNVVAPGTNQVVTLYGSVNSKPLEAGVHLINPITKSLTPELVNYTEATKWNSVLPSTALTGTIPILNVK